MSSVTGSVIQVDEVRILGHVDEVVRSSVEATLNGLKGEFAYVLLDGIWLKRSWGGEVKNVAVLVAIGVDQDGFRQVLGVAEGIKEDGASRRNFLHHLKERGLQGVQLVTSDKCLGLVEALGEFYLDAD